MIRANTLEIKIEDLSKLIRQNFNKKNCKVIRFDRHGKFKAVVLFKYKDSFGKIESELPKDTKLPLERINGQIYLELTEQKFYEFEQKFAHVTN